MRNKNAFVQSDKYSLIGETDHEEKDELLGVTYFWGLLAMNLHNLNHLFADYEGHFAFGENNVKNRFKFLLTHITFDDYTDHQKNW